MNSLNKLRSLPNEAISKLRAIYAGPLSFEIRCALGNWIDNQPWFDLAANNEESMKHANDLLKQFFAELVNLSSITVDVCLKMRCFQAIEIIEQSYCYEPFNFVLLVQNCLMQEMSVLNEFEASNSAQNDAESQNVLRFEPGRFLRIENSTANLELQLENLQQQQLSLFQLVGQQQNFPRPTLPEHFKLKVILDSDVKTHGEMIIQTRRNCLIAVRDNLNSIGIIQKAVIGEIKSWKSSQQKNGNGDLCGLDLEQIQVSVECLINFLCLNKRILRSLNDLALQLQSNDDFALQIKITNEEIGKSLSRLVQESLIVVDQPTRVLKKGVLVSCRVRLLTGSSLEG